MVCVIGVCGISSYLQFDCPMKTQTNSSASIPTFCKGHKVSSEFVKVIYCGWHLCIRVEESKVLKRQEMMDNIRFSAENFFKSTRPQIAPEGDSFKVKLSRCCDCSCCLEKGVKSHSDTYTCRV